MSHALHHSPMSLHRSKTNSKIVAAAESYKKNKYQERPGGPAYENAAVLLLPRL